MMAEGSKFKAVCCIHNFSSGYIYAPSVILTMHSAGTTLVLYNNSCFSCIDVILFRCLFY